VELLETGGHDEQIRQEEALERARRVIPPDACPKTPPHLDEFDPSYLRDYDEDVVEKRANDTRQHPVINYMVKQKMVEEAREENPNVVAKDLGVDYRFWNVLHSNFYTLVIFNSKKSKIVKMQYIDWEELREKNDPNFNRGNLGL
jgi:hypothetical protein